MMGTDPDNRIPAARPRLPFPGRPIIGLPAGHLKDASGAATAAGLHPVLDPPGQPPRTWQLSGETGDASHARPHSARAPQNPP